MQLSDEGNGTRTVSGAVIRVFDEEIAASCQKARKSKSLGGYQAHQGASDPTCSLVVPAQRVLSSLVQVRLGSGYG
jgi:hypothetical protein